jgi:hypothetical protein
MFFQVASYQAPGRYVLKPELEVEISKLDASGTGRYDAFLLQVQYLGFLFSCDIVFMMFSP